MIIIGHNFVLLNLSFQQMADCPDSIRSLWCNLKKLEGAIGDAGYFIRAY